MKKSKGVPKKDNFTGYADIIKNMPDDCAYCGKKHPAGTIQHIRILDKGERVCDVECAKKLIERWEHMYAHMISDLRKRRMELEEGILE